MDSSRTRFLLRALRPNGADHDDPTFREALALTRSDPELGQWFAREQAVDRALSAKLREVRPPAELRAHILQGLAVSPKRQAYRPWTLAAAGLAAAASIALLLYVAWPSSTTGKPSFDLIVAAAVSEAAQAPAPEFASSDAAAIKSWLEQQAAPVPRELPGALGQQTPRGAGVVEWRGVTCSLVTWDVPSLGGAAASASAVQLYTVRRNSCSSEGVGPTPRVVARDNASVATWRDAENFYIVVTLAPVDRLRELLGPTAQIARASVAGPVTVVAMASIR